MCFVLCSVHDLHEVLSVQWCQVVVGTVLLSGQWCCLHSGVNTVELLAQHCCPTVVLSALLQGCCQHSVVVCTVVSCCCQHCGVVNTAVLSVQWCQVVVGRVVVLAQHCCLHSGVVSTVVLSAQ